MNILLLNPPARKRYMREGRCQHSVKSVYLWPQLSLAYIASMLKDENIFLIDAILENKTINEIKSFIKKKKIEFVILNISTPSANSDYEVVKELKKENIITASIGTHTSFMYKEALNNGIDYVIIGEPELICFNLVNALKNKIELSKIKGIAYKKNKKIIINLKQEYIQTLDTLPFPRHDLLKLNLYDDPFAINKPFASVLTSRGCTHFCIYCAENAYYGRKYRYRSPENIVEEIKYLKKIGIKEIRFQDAEFCLIKKNTKALLKLMIKEKLNITWQCSARANNLTEDLLRLMKKAGCHLIYIGVESASPIILNNIKKGNNYLEYVKKTFNLTKKIKIKTMAHYIFGLPGETKKTVNQTLKFMKKIPSDYISVNIASPFPGTEFFDYLKKKENIVYNWDKYDPSTNIVFTPNNVSQEYLKKAVKKSYRNFYLSPRYAIKVIKEIIKDPKQFVKYIHTTKNLLEKW